MALVGRVYCENLLIALGGGRNDKSTYYNVQLSVLGTGYAGTINPEVLTADKRKAGADLATLKGNKNLVRADGKNTVQRTTKTESGRRTIPLNSRALEAIRHLKALSTSVIKCKKTPVKKCRFPAERSAI